MNDTSSFKDSIQQTSFRRPTVLRELQHASSVVAKQQCHPIFMQVIAIDDDDNTETDDHASFSRQEHAEEVNSLLYFHQKREELEKTSMSFEN